MVLLTNFANVNDPLPTKKFYIIGFRVVMSLPIFQNISPRRSVLHQGRGQQQRNVRQRPAAVRHEEGERAERNRARLGPSNRDDEAAVPRPPGQGDLLRVRAWDRSGANVIKLFAAVSYDFS
jgi:hypothetical protein